MNTLYCIYKKNISLSLIRLLFLVLGISGCTDNDSNSFLITGQFIDDPVQGLHYECSSGQKGVTNLNGEYICNADSQVTLYVGGRKIGTVDTQRDFLTPYSFFPEDQNSAINLASLLQSIDSDGQKDNNTISIDSSFLFPDNISFDSLNFREAIEAALSIVLISPIEAQNRLHKSIVNAGGQIPDVTILADATALVITVLGDNPASVIQGATYSDAGATATDNVDGAVSVNSSGTVDTSIVGTYTITYTATDSAGNQATATRTVNVTAAPDTTPPIITVLGDNPASVVQGATYSDAGATATDNVDGAVSVNSSGTVDTSIVGTYTITYTATDSAGNQATATRTVNVTAAPDTTPPIITVLGDNPASVIQGATYSDAGATATDNVDGAVSVNSSGTVDTSIVGTYTITYTATDSAGNQATATRTVNVTAAPDTTPPIITVLGDNPASVVQGATYSDAGATATDNVDGAVSVNSSGTVDTSIVGTYTITYTATDSAGNQATANRTVNVTVAPDTTPPVITVLGDNPDSVVQGATYSDAGATATDNVDGAVSVNSSGTVDTSIVGTYTITYTATDSAGNQATANRTVNVTVAPDTTPPVITVLGDNPDSVVQGATYSDAGATATDNVDGAVSVNSSGTVDTSIVGTYTITYTATDSAGNQATANRTVNVTVAPDTTPPVITVLGDNPDSVVQGATYSDAGATATDNVDGAVSVNSSGTVDTSIVGTYTITYTATDSAGNQATANRTVNVTVAPDTTPPVITVLGDNPDSVVQGATYSDAGATATDNVDGAVSVNSSGTVDTSIVGTYTITYTATDSAGNTASATRTVNVAPSTNEDIGVNISSVRGNTATYNSIAEFDVSLKSNPQSDVLIPVSSSNENKGVVTVESLTFTPDNWDQPQTLAIKGRNHNVVNGIQDYRIILAAAQSGDSNYNGFDSDDVEMKGIILSLSEPTDSLNLIAGLDATIEINTAYTGNERLSYILEEKPDGMAIDINSGLISWTPPQLTEGNSYSVKVKVTDGILFSEITFNIEILTATPLQLQTTDNSVFVTDEDSNLQGLSIQLIDESLAPSDIVLSKLPDTGMPAVPVYVQRVTDFFISNNPISGELKVKLPLARLPIGTDLQQLDLYSLAESDDIDGKFWSPIGIDVDISEVQGESVVEVFLSGLEGAFFIGIDLNSNTENRTVVQGREILARTEISDVSCTPEEKTNGTLNYNKQVCQTISNNKLEITVLKFGSASTSTRWNGTTIEELITWLIDAQEGFDDLGMEYDNKFTVRIHSMPKPSYLGYVTTKNNENRKTLHLTSANKAKNIMQGTSVHEYFHHAQSRSNIVNRDLLIDGGKEKRWFIEGTARWFEDYLFDTLDTYTSTEGRGNRILEAGVNGKGDNGIFRPYQRFSFFKLINSKCNEFESIYKKLLNIDRSTDSSGIINFNSELLNANCNFSNHLGLEKASTLEAALLYYQYSTLYKNQISLLDFNEDDTAFKFKPTIYSYEKSDWFDVGEVKSANVSQITNIPAYGAYSIKVKGDIWDDIEDGKEAVLRVRVNTGSSPLTVSLLSEDASFIGNTSLDGIQHRHYKTNEISEYIFTQDELVPFFITLLNPNSADVSVSEVVFEIRDKLSPELEVTSPTDNSNVNNRVISVTGNVPDDATDVDQIIVTNGNIRTITTVAGDRSFSADVVVAIGNNALVAQGYNSNDLTKPLTKEKIINVTGVENAAVGQNALIPSRVALVLRWKTNGTDIDLYSTDKNDRTIWHSNKTVSPGILDYDNTSGYGPEVISYRKTDEAVYVDGEFDIDVHFYSGSTPTAYSLDVILNETDAANVKFRHYESVQTLTNSNSSEDGPTGSGSSRFNDILSVSCNAQRICLIGAVDTRKLSNTTTATQARSLSRTAQYTSTQASVTTSQHNQSAYAKCMSEYNRNIEKSGYVAWLCNSQTGAKVWY